MITKIPPAGYPPPVPQIVKSYFSLREPDKKKINELLGDEGKICFFSSGRMALFAILEALRKIYPRKNRIIIPAYTCPVIVEVIRRVGLQIDLVDLEKDSFIMQRREVENKFSEDTLAILIVHLFGYPHPVWKGFPVIEDAAQAMGTLISGKFAGTSGKAGFFSFGKGKNLTLDRGGMVFTRDENLFHALPFYSYPYPPAISFLRLLLFTIFATPKGWKILEILNLPREESSYFNRDSRTLSSFHLRLLEKQLQSFPEEVKKRRNRAEFIRNLLEEISFIKTLSYPEDSIPSLTRLPFLVKRGKRKEIKILFQKRGWDVTTMYGKIIPEIFPYFPSPSKFPNAYRLSRELLTFPLRGYREEKFIKDWNWIKKRITG